MNQRFLIIVVAVACSLIPSVRSARGDYFATVLAPATFNPAVADILRLDEQTGAPVPGFNFTLTDGSTLVAPSSITVGPDQFLYVSDFGTGGIFRINPASGAGQQIGLLPPVAFQPEFIPSAAGSLRFGPNFTLFLSSPNTDKVFEVDIASNTVLNEIELPLTSFPTGMNFDNDGKLLVSALQTGVVHRIDGADISIAITPDTPTPSNPSGPVGVLPTPDGRYWVTNIFRNSVRLFDPSGVPLRAGLQVPPMLPDEIPPGATALTNSPSDLSFDNEGNILLATQGLLEGMGSLFRIERPAGDFNGDMVVDAHDYSLWRSRFGMTPLAGNYDGNGDGRYDAADYAVWRDTLGSTGEFVEILGGQGQSYSSILQFTPLAISQTGGTTVPEPATLAIVVVGAIGGIILIRKLR